MSKKLIMNNYNESGLMPITNGLVCWLDGRDYITGEYIWRDRSGNNKDAILNRAGVQQNGILHLNGYGNIENPTLNLEEYTIEVNLTDLLKGYWNGLFGNTAGTTGTSVYLGGGDAIGIHPPSEWYNNLIIEKNNIIITVLYKMKKIKMYLNGNLLREFDSEIEPSTAKNMIICARKPNGAIVDTNTATDSRLNNWHSFKVYNRALTEKEIYQNYLYERSIDRRIQTETILATGSLFNSIINELKAESGSNITKIVFTESAIPEDKLENAKIISNGDGSYVNCYAYVDNSTIYISPEVEGCTIYANNNCSSMFKNQTSLTNIEFNNFNTSNVTYMSDMFWYCSSLTALDVSNFNVENVIGINNMFRDCKSLKALDLSNWKANKLTSIGEMFSTCTSLNYLDISGLNTSKVTNFQGVFYNCQLLESIDISTLDTSSATSLAALFESCINLKNIIGLERLNTSKVTNMRIMFNACHSLTSLDLHNFNTSNVTNMEGLFKNCKSLTSLNISNFNTSNVTTMYSMFEGCIKLSNLDLSNFNTTNVTNMNSMFRTCSSLTLLDLSNFNTSSLKDIKSMFDACAKLTEIKGIEDFDVSNVNSLYWLFTGCSSLTSLDLSKWNTSNVTNMQTMFSGCTSLENINVSGWNTSRVSIFLYMFNFCKNLKEIDLSNFDTSSATDIHLMFGNCTNLKTIKGLEKFDISNVSNMNQMFQNSNKVSAKITINNPNIKSYTSIFTNTSTDPDSKFVVKYVDEETKSMAEKLVATKSANSNVLLWNGEGEPVMDGLICWLDGRDGQSGNTEWKDRSGNENIAEVIGCEWAERSLKINNNSDEFLLNKVLIDSNDKPYTLEIYFKSFEKPTNPAVVIKANSIKEWGSSTSIYLENEQAYYDIGKNVITNNFEYNNPCFITIVKKDMCDRESFLNAISCRKSSNPTNGISFLGNWGSTHSKQEIYSIRLYNRALTEEEIRQNYEYEQSIDRRIQTKTTLVTGTLFNNIVNELKSKTVNTITKIEFTEKAIPKDKLESAKIVSNGNQDYVNCYAYVEDDTIYVSPEVKGCTIYANNDCSKMFYQQSNLKTIIFECFNTDNVENMHDMFSMCSSIEELDLSNFRTSNLVNMHGMFYGFTKPCVLKLDHFSFEKVNNMTYTFHNSPNISGSIIINNPSISTITHTFNNTSTSSDSKFVVKYTNEETRVMAEKLVATKTSNSNVFLADKIPVFDGLVCWLDGRDGSGTNVIWKDRSGNGNDFTLRNFTFDGETNGWFNGALKKDTKNSQCADVILKNAITNGYSVNILLNKYEDKKNGGVIALNDKNGGIYGGMSFTNHTYENMLTNFSSYTKPIYNGVQFPFETGVWTFYSIIQKPSCFEYYVNGNLYCSIPKVNDKWVELTTIALFKILGHAIFSNISIGSLTVYDRTLTEEEIKHNYLYEQSINRGE